MWNLIKSTVIISGFIFFITLKWLIITPFAILAAIWGGKRLLDEVKALEKEKEKEIIEHENL